MLGYGGIVNVISISIYTPLLFLAALLTYRHGLGHNASWVFLILFCLVRLVQNSLDIAATVIFPPASASNTSYETGVAILNELGLSPLLMSTVCLLSLVSSCKGRRMGWILTLISIPILISLILIIAGSIDPTSRDGPTFAANGEIRAGMALYLACFIVIAWCTAVIMLRISRADEDETKILLTVALTLPLLTVRVVYNMLFAYESLWGDQRYNIISGSETLQLCMQVIEEYVVVIAYLWLGLQLHFRRKREGRE